MTFQINGQEIARKFADNVREGEFGLKETERPKPFIFNQQVSGSTVSFTWR